MASVRVILADDHAVVREGYRRLLERASGLAVIGEADSGAAGYRQFVALAPDVTVMDVSLPDVSGIEVLRRIRARDPQARVLIFSMHEEPVCVTRSLAAGARGYVTKASAPELLVEAVRAVARGGGFVSPDLRAATPDATPVDCVRALSTREFEILRLLAGGGSVDEIARRLSLSGKTVANYQTAIRQKLGARSGAELVHIALRSGLLAQGGAGGGASRP